MKPALTHPSSPTPVRTQPLVRHLSASLEAYGDAAAADRRDAATAAASEILARYEGAKTGVEDRIEDPAPLGTRLGGAKLDSLAWKLARTPEYQAHQGVAAAFFQQVSPALGARLQQAAAQAELVATASGLADLRQEVSDLREDRDALAAECDAIAARRASFFASVPDRGVTFKTGGVAFHISKEALEKSSYLSALASGLYTEQPNHAGHIKISDITADELRAVVEFLEKDKIADLNSFGPERLYDVALQFGSEDMMLYVKDPRAYHLFCVEQQRLARLRAAGGAAAIPEGYVRIEAGSFTMGSPADEVCHRVDEVQHEVRITRPFLLKQTPVTQDEWQTLMGNNPSHFSRDTDSGRRPVENVSWFDALAYCNALSRHEGLQECYDLSGLTGTPGSGDCRGPESVPFDRSANGYCLPTEAQWEYAARAGSRNDLYGDRFDVAWFFGSRTLPVGLKRANAWGLHDMFGNVAEWVWDLYASQGKSQETAEDPHGPDISSVRLVRRVQRGGSWASPASDVRAASRAWAGPFRCDNEAGFRPARLFA